MLSVATVNVNGVRAAVRRGMGSWLAERAPDVLCLQEVRADDAVLRSLLAEVAGDGWHVAHAEPTDPGTRGRAGVAVATRLPVGAQREDVERPAVRSRVGVFVRPAPRVVRKLLDIAPGAVAARLRETGGRGDERLEPLFPKEAPATA